VPVSSPARSGMRRTRRVCGPFVQVACRWCAVCKVVKGRRLTDEVGGPRTQQCGDAKHSVKAPSAWRRWELQADKTAVCGTQAKTCFRGPGSSSSFFDDGLNHCPQAERQAGCPYVSTYGRRGRGSPPSRSARPFGSKRERRPASPGAGQRMGAVTRVRTVARISEAPSGEFQSRT
jgi:hypothetical protein